MKEIKKIIVLLIVVLSSQAFSQVSTLETKGTKHYKNFSFYKAIDKYEEVGVERLTTVGLRNLADAHRYTHNTEKAEQYYAVLSTKPDNKAEDLLMYAEMLLMNGKPEEYDKWMNSFHMRLAQDSRGQEFAAKKGEYNRLKVDNRKFEIFNLDINTEKEDFGPAFYKNQVVFASSRKHNLPIKRIWNWNKFPYLNIYESDLTADKKLTNVKRLSKKINKKYHEGPATYSADGNLMVFTRNNYDEKSSDNETKLTMFYREKDSEGKWGKIISYSFNDKEYSVGHPALSADGKTLYFVSDMPGGIGQTDIYKIERKNNVWTKPVNLGNVINTEGKEMFPFYHEEGMLFFASDGHVGLGGLDVFISTVKDTTYGEIKNLGYPLNDSKDDFGFVLDSEQKFGFFSSNRPGGHGSDDIYAFNLLNPYCKEIKGLVVDLEDSILPGSTVVLTDAQGNVVAIDTVGDDAAYRFCVEPGNYKLRGSKVEYRDGKNTANPKEESGPIIANLVLAKDTDFGLYALITDKNTGLPLEGVNVVLINKLTNTRDTILTPETGDFEKELIEKNLNDNISYDFELTKQGYLSKTVTYNKKLIVPGVDTVSADLSMDPFEVGGDLSKLIEINPIFFDLNKSFIRPDAAIELDKIVAIMNEYPEMYIELGSHTDCRASKRYNEKLSDRRAKSSAKYIASRITNPKRIYGKGYGESQLINHCECEGRRKVPCTEEEHQINRRTEFKITKFNVKNVKAVSNPVKPQVKKEVETKKQDIKAEVKEVKKEVEEVETEVAEIITEVKKEVVEPNTDVNKAIDFGLYALVTDKKSGLPLEGVTVTITNNQTKSVETVLTPATGDFERVILNKKLNDEISYDLKLEKEGYLSKTVTYTKKLDKPGIYKVDADLTLGKIEVGGDLSKIIEINPIYFDLDKSFIRPDAAKELDKIVKIMNEYPGMYIELGSHTDCRASKRYNEKLSDRRAKSSAAYIAARIKNPARIYGKGYGEVRLINKCECEGAKVVPCTEEEHQENRRTEFRVVKFDVEGVKAKSNGPDSFDKK